MRILILLSLFIFVSCGKTLPVTDVRSLSGKSYNALDRNVRLIKDFKTNALMPMGDSIKVTGGMFFTLKKGLPSLHGSDLYFYEDATQKWTLVADLEPGRAGASVSSFSDPGGDYVYFLAKGVAGHYRIHKVHKTTFVVTELPDTTGGSTFNPKTEEGSFIVVQETPSFIAYGTATNSGTEVLHKYEDNGTITYTNFNTIINPKMMTKIIHEANGTPYVVGVNQAGSFFAAHWNDTINIETNYSNIKKIIPLRETGTAVEDVASFLATGPSGTTIYTYKSGGSPGALEDLKLTSSIANVVDMVKHKNKLYYLADLEEYTCSGGVIGVSAALCSVPSAIGKELGVYDPASYQYWLGQGFDTVDIYTGAANNSAIDIAGPPSYQSSLVSAGDYVCMSGEDGTDGVEVICVDDSNYANQYFLDGLYSYPKDLTYINQSLFFVAETSAGKTNVIELDLSTTPLASNLTYHGTSEQMNATEDYAQEIKHLSSESIFYTTPFAIMETNYVIAGVAAGNAADLYQAYNGDSQNHSSIPLLRFSHNGILYGNYYTDMKKSWSVNPNTGETHEYDLGAIVSDHYVEVGTKIYFSSVYRGNAVLAYIDVNNHSFGKVTKSCANSSQVAESCVYTGSYPRKDHALKFLFHQGSYIFYEARLIDDADNTFGRKLYRYDTSSGAVRNIDNSVVNPKILFYDENLFIYSSHEKVGAPSNYYLKGSTDNGTSVSSVICNTGGCSSETITKTGDFTVADNTLFFSAKTTASSDFYLYSTDLSNTASFDFSSAANRTSEVSSSSSTLQASLQLYSDHDNFIVLKTDQEVKKYDDVNDQFVTLHTNASSKKIYDGFQSIVTSANEYFVYNARGEVIRSDNNLTDYDFDCPVSAINLRLNNFTILEHCDNSGVKMALYLRESKQKIDLTMLGFNWLPSVSEVEILYETNQRAVLGLRKLKLNNGSYVTDIYKVIDINFDPLKVSFIHENSYSKIRHKLNDGVYFDCETPSVTSPDGGKVKLYDFVNNDFKTLAPSYNCINSDSFASFFHTFDGGNSFQFMLKIEDPKATKGWELYNLEL